VNYQPNSFDGPIDDKQFLEPPLKISGDADRYDHRKNNDDYSVIMAEALADRLANAGHDLVHEKFCVDDMLRDIEAIYLLAVGGTVSNVPDRTGVSGGLK
jgi:hypothetical protein